MSTDSPPPWRIRCTAPGTWTVACRVKRMVGRRVAVDYVTKQDWTFRSGAEAIAAFDRRRVA